MDKASTGLKPRILVAPLDWGLGHATRCIPVIHELLRQNCSVVLAGEGKIKLLLQKEFPHLAFHDLKGYDISYSRNKWSLPFVMATQIPKILSAIKYENERLKELVEELQIDGIISDNRYGLYHSAIPSILISHQLLIKTHLGKTADEYLQKLNYSYIDHFSECWVPDYEGNSNLGGELSHPEKLPQIPVKYLGPLSRFQTLDLPPSGQLLLLLSGPEPQRTILENMLLEQLKDQNIPTVLVRGFPGAAFQPDTPANVKVYDHLPAAELNKIMAESSMIISRCGYSTVMDLAALKKKSILIPTPGQTEQEYLAEHLMQKNFALSIDQEKFRLKGALELAQSFHYKTDLFHHESHLQSAVRSFLYKIAFKVFNR